MTILKQSKRKEKNQQDVKGYNKNPCLLQVYDSRLMECSHFVM